jgi:hypothetical protein
LIFVLALRRIQTNGSIVVTKKEIFFTFNFFSRQVSTTICHHELPGSVARFPVELEEGPHPGQQVIVEVLFQREADLVHPEHGGADHLRGQPLELRRNDVFVVVPAADCVKGPLG